jgi:hypothetical protein
MWRFIVTATAGLVAVCFAGGCTSSAQPPPVIFGGATQSPVGTGTTTAAAGNAGLSSGQLDAAITAATTRATAVHVTGTLTPLSTLMTLDAHLNRNGPSWGTLGYQGASFPFVANGGVDYFQLTTSLMTLLKMTDPAAKGKWVTSTSSSVEALVFVFSPFLTLNSFLKSGTAGNDDTFTYVGHQQFGSQHVTVYQERSSIGLGETYDYDFPAVGAALPLRTSGGGSDEGVDLDFTWNQPTTAEVPPLSEIYTGS